jgi:hypothetical protein
VITLKQPTYEVKEFDPDEEFDEDVEFTYF